MAFFNSRKPTNDEITKAGYAMYGLLKEKNPFRSANEIKNLIQRQINECNTLSELDSKWHQLCKQYNLNPKQAFQKYGPNNSNNNSNTFTWENDTNNNAWNTGFGGFNFSASQSSNVGKSYPCTKCDRFFGTQKGLAGHLGWHAKQEKEQNVKKFEAELAKHIKMGTIKTNKDGNPDKRTSEYKALEAKYFIYS
mmetsp:Transcript_36277/g.44755  ORF Transcript_36277/g.44755 Transcript_36277/m.44755 type:complete len:194 (-) Transcript_36277:35-616(-)